MHWMKWCIDAWNQHLKHFHTFVISHNTAFYCDLNIEQILLNWQILGYKTPMSELPMIFNVLLLFVHSFSLRLNRWSHAIPFLRHWINQVNCLSNLLKLKLFWEIVIFVFRSCKLLNAPVFSDHKLVGRHDFSIKQWISLSSIWISEYWAWVQSLLWNLLKVLTALTTWLWSDDKQ